MKKTLFIVASLLALIVMGVNLYKPQSDQEVVVEETVEQNSIIQDKELEIVDSSVVLTGVLIDVSGGNSTGKAQLTRKDGNLEHMVEADLPDPEPGLLYEGWLVNKTTGVKFFSTGVMEKVVEKYVLEFSANEESLGYNEVVITLETKIDDVPEEHILEGIVK